MPHLAVQDPDDYMRLLQVRDLLAGQSWWDVHQYRMNPPFGADMHWSRLVDLPIACFIMLFRMFLPDQTATIAAMAVVPLVQMLAAMAVMRRLVLALGESEVMALAAAAILPMFPLISSTFLPLRIDHHGWQAVMALACVWAMVRRDAAGSAWAGVAAAVWLSISLEGLMLVAAITALFALRYLWRAERHLAPFLAAEAGAATLIFFLTRPLSAWSNPQPDQLSAPHIAAFAVGAALAWAVPQMPGQTRLVGRAMGLSGIALVALTIIMLPLGLRAINPFYGMDPLVHSLWFLHIPEGLPITAQDCQTVLMVLWTLLLILAGWVMVALGQAKRPQLWNDLGAVSVIAALLSMVVMRTAVATQLLAAPFCTVMLAQALPYARRMHQTLPRVTGTLATLLLLTPSGASGLGKIITHYARGPQAEAPVSQTGGATCDLAQLNRLPKTLIFATLDIGPEILVRTPHSVVISGYHRNQLKMREVIDAFSGDPARARQIVIDNKARYVVLCAGDVEPQVFAQRRGDSLAGKLLAGQAPPWLVPVAHPVADKLRIWRVVG